MNQTTLYKCVNKLCLTIINNNNNSGIQLNNAVVVAVVVRVCAELTSKNETGGGFVNVFRATVDVVEKSTFVNKSVVVVSIVLVDIVVVVLVVIDVVDVFIVVDDVDDVFSFSIVVEKLNSDIDDVANTFEVVVKTGH